MFRFGAGEMRVFARTARPIGGVEVQTPVLVRDFTLDAAPISIAIDATLVDAANRKLAGAAPMQVRVVDPLGNVRYDLYRATDMGTLRLSLPLAANDPAGTWMVTVKELLDNHAGSAKFLYTPAGQCGLLAGATPRAVFFGNDRENIFRFIRTHQDVTIVKGTSDYCGAAAERLAAGLKPWGIRATIVAAAEVNKPRPLTAEEAKTWVGLEFGRAEAGAGNRPQKVGFVLAAPAILLGNPADNPLIEFVRSTGFLPYPPSRGLPRPGTRLPGLASRRPRFTAGIGHADRRRCPGHVRSGRLVLRSGGRHRSDDAVDTARRHRRDPRRKEPATAGSNGPLAGRLARSRALLVPEHERRATSRRSRSTVPPR